MNSIVFVDTSGLLLIFLFTFLLGYKHHYLGESLLRK